MANPTSPVPINRNVPASGTSLPPPVCAVPHSKLSKNVYVPPVGICTSIVENGVSDVTPKKVGGAVEEVGTLNGVERAVTVKFRPTGALNRLMPNAVTGVGTVIWAVEVPKTNPASPVPKLANEKEPVLVSATPMVALDSPINCTPLSEKAPVT